MVFLGERPKLLDALVRVSPHVVVEVLSPRPRDVRRDRVDKLADYGAARAKYYWIIDPQVRTLEIFELGARGRFSHALAAKEGRLARVPGCDGLKLDLDDLWAALDAEAEQPTRPTPRKRKR